MADLALGSGRPFSLITTVVHRGPGRCKFAQLDLHLASGGVRLRFLDTESLSTFVQALVDLSHEAIAPDPLDYRPVRSCLYTEQDDFLREPATAHPVQRSLFGEQLPY